ncbi:MAG: pseudoazurin [Boseongicola sp.]|nr:pseudoazurin [Boseongicola sp.]NNJ68339.1 pseudoazurin [Boseongicola sp.]
MFPKLVVATGLAVMMASSAVAETIEVQMLNKGSDGSPMVFEPSYVKLAPGDTLKFIATDRGHNAESIMDRSPEGSEDFKGKINQEIEVTFDIEGWYAIQCKPHFAMGMVMAVEVGDADVPEDFLEGRLPRRAKDRLEAAVANGQ